MSVPSTIYGKKVLITGGLGFIGSNLAHKCLELGAVVSIYDCLDPRSGGNMQNVHAIRDHVEIIVNDIRNLESLCTAIMNKDILFSCAAYTSHPQSMKEPMNDIEVNCKGIINILEAVRRFNPKMKVVHVGTSTQIGRMVQPVIDENHPEFPLDIYSANKTASEKYVLIYGRSYGMRTTVIRLANVFGPRSNIRSSDFGFINYFIGLALQKREIQVFGDGSQHRNITFIDDCVEALVSAAVSEKVDREALFAVADKHYTIAEIANAINTHIGGTVRFVPWPREREVIEIGESKLSNEKIKRALNWSPRISMEDGLKRTKAYFEGSLSAYL
jgi:UDP-glucose 4-epimerase